MVTGMRRATGGQPARMWELQGKERASPASRVVKCRQRGQGMAAGLWGSELDPLEALRAENMEALQHSRAFVVLVVLLIADGTLHIHGLPRGVT